MTTEDPCDNAQGMDYWPGETQIVSKNNCFLCGILLNDQTRTDEHVFPKWLLTEFDLWDSQLDLLNKTGISYGNLRIPSCIRCNGTYLSEIENTVATAYRGGFESFEKLDSNVLFLWLAKICYGILVRESSLAVDRAEPVAGPIVRVEFLKLFRIHHYLLQRIIGKVTWDQNPASILLLRTKESALPSTNFDFGDGPHGPFIALRMGPIGVIAILQDWGLHSQFGWPPFNLERAKKIVLAPIQFREVMARGRDCAMRLNHTALLMIAQNGGIAKVMCLPPVGLAPKPLWNPFSIDFYGKLLANELGWSLSRVYDGDNLKTWIDGVSSGE